jgi:hypothetical protein
MVDPISDEERSAFALKVKVAIVVLVGGSAGLVAVANGASLALAGGAVLAGLVVGVVLVVIVFPGSGGTSSNRYRR